MCLSEPTLLPVWGVTTSIRTFTHLSPAIVGHVDACLIWKHSLCSIRLRTCFLTRHVSQVSSQTSKTCWRETKRIGKRLLTKWQTKKGKKKVWVLVKPKLSSIESRVLFEAPYWLTLVFPWYLTVAMVNSLLRPHTSEEQLLFTHYSPLLCPLLFPDNLPLSVADFESLLPNSFESEGHVFIAPR